MGGSLRKLALWRPLLLAAGKDDAALTDKCIISVRHLHDVIVNSGADSRLHNFAVCRVGTAIADILHDSARKQEDILLDDPDVFAQALLREIARISCPSTVMRPSVTS